MGQGRAHRRRRPADRGGRGAGRTGAGRTGRADLGGYLFKKRIARSGSGKSGGYRTILGFRKGTDRVFFLFGFAKNERATVTETERAALGGLAASLIGATEEDLVEAIARGTIVELEIEE